MLQYTNMKSINVTYCPQREEYLSFINNEENKTRDNYKQVAKMLQEKYLQHFHDYVAERFQNLRYEIGEETVYWNYNFLSGVYEEVKGVTVREWVIKLLVDEELTSKASDAFAKTVLARYRACYADRGSKYDDFDSDDRWFHANNGWVNLETLEFQQHKPERLSRVKSAVDYIKEADCPTYDKFLDKDLCLRADQVRVIDQFSGLTLVNDIKYQKMLTLLGRPGCGKSTLLDAWMNVLGQKGMEKKLTELQGDSMRFAGVQFVGSTLCWFDEVDVKKAEMGNSLGTLITGQHINVERKGINGIIKARNTIKCVLTANRLPMAAELGIYRRLIMIPIKVSFVEDGIEQLDMPDRLRLEASGVLNRMIRGLQDLRKMGRFTVIEGHDDLIEEYKAQSDTMAEFLETYFVPAGKNMFVSNNDLFNSYQQFAEGNSFTKSITPQKFGRLLATQPLNAFSKIFSDKKNGVRGWFGLKLKDEFVFNTKTGVIEYEI